MIYFWLIFVLLIPIQVKGHETHPSPEHLGKAPHHQKKEPSVRLDFQQIKAVKGKKIVQIKLTHLNTGRPVTLTDLKEVHTQKIHLLIIDDSLEDYSHVHPRP